MFKRIYFLLLIFTALLSSSFVLKNSVFTSKPIIKKNVDPICADYFSPNGDGHNDFFIIKNLEEFPINKLFIFNRWGETLYESEPYKNDWDGKMNIKHPLFGETLPEGMYFYRFEYYVGDFLTHISGKIILKR